MSRTKSPPAAAEYAVLGLLQQAPAHGYAIAQRFTPGHDLGLLCPMDQSSVYALLHDLERQDLVQGRQELAGARPPRTVFQITPEGDAMLRAWLNEPVDPLRRLRLDFLLKLYLLRRSSPGAAAALVRGQIRVCKAYADRLQQDSAALTGDSLERLVIESKYSALAGVIDWLRRERDELELTPSAQADPAACPANAIPPLVSP